MTALIVILGALAVVLAVQLGLPFFRARRRAEFRRTAFQPAWRATLRAAAPLYQRLPERLKPRLESLIGVFVAEKEFVGCDGLEVTETMKLAIATQACLLILNRKDDVYDHLRSILVYPSAFLVPQREVDDAGVVTEEHRELIGQAWDSGRIILSWADVERLQETADPHANVVLHEFAHYLDYEDGVGNGAPLLAGPLDYERWSGIMRSAYSRVWHRLRSGRGTVIDEYALEDEAEFFAVATETFFERSAALQQEDPALYDELARFYQLDPATW